MNNLIRGDNLKELAIISTVVVKRDCEIIQEIT